jgi:hypothetical protein
MPQLSLRARRELARGFNYRDIKAIGNRYFWGLGNRAVLQTALGTPNADLYFYARTPGTAGNSIRVRIVVAGNSTPLSVVVAGSDITVNSATDSGGAATSTARDVVRAINFDNKAGGAGLLVHAQHAPANDGTGVVSALAYTNLAGAV